MRRLLILTPLLLAACNPGGPGYYGAPGYHGGRGYPPGYYGPGVVSPPVHAPYYAPGAVITPQPSPYTPWGPRQRPAGTMGDL